MSPPQTDSPAAHLLSWPRQQIQKRQPFSPSLCLFHSTSPQPGVTGRVGSSQGWTQDQNQPLLVCILRGFVLPSTCRLTARTAHVCGGKPTSSASPRLPLGWEAGQAGQPALAAVHGVGEERGGGTAGSCPGTAARSQPRPHSFHLPSSERSAEAAQLCSGK